MFSHPQVIGAVHVHLRTILTITIIVFAAGCSDPNKEVRGQFLSGCVQGGVSKSVCFCTFQKLEEKYTPDEMKRLQQSTGSPPVSFLRDVMSSAVACRKN